jgi:hypothetical protein
MDVGEDLLEVCFGSSEIPRLPYLLDQELNGEREIVLEEGWHQRIYCDVI